VSRAIRPGQEWAQPIDGPPDLEVTGDDAALARAVEHAHARGITCPLVRFRPEASSSLARAVGLAPGGSPDPHVALPFDALVVEAGEHYGRRLAVNAVVSGVVPARLRSRHPSIAVRVTADGRPVGASRATTAAVLNGQYLGDADVAPRGHPGDGRAEVVVLAVDAKDRKAMRERMARGDHVPHPGIAIVSARAAGIEWADAQPFEVDGYPVGRRRVLDVAVLPQAFRLLV
jgi:hypothetical protein